MIVVELSGGMGNQLFQTATAAALAKKRNVEFVLSTTQLDDRSKKAHFTYRNFALEPFGLQSHVQDNPFKSLLPHASDGILKRIKRRLKGLDVHYERNLSFDGTVLELGKTAYLNGYYQSERYFVSEKAYVQKLLTVHNGLGNEVANKIRLNTSKKVLGVHVRRGDYVQDAQINAIHGAMPIEYYKQAYQHVQGQTPIDSVLIFSDDPDWADQNLSGIFDCEVAVSRNLSGLEDFELMRSCSSFIIANSSFSWWAAWLGETDKTVVVAPKKWFNDPGKNSDDLIPERWIRL